MWYQRKIALKEKGVHYPRKYFVGNFKVYEWQHEDERRINKFITLEKVISVKDQARIYREKELEDKKYLVHADKVINRHQRIVDRGLASSQNIKDVIHYNEGLKDILSSQDNGKEVISGDVS